MAVRNPNSSLNSRVPARSSPLLVEHRWFHQKLHGTPAPAVSAITSRALGTRKMLLRLISMATLTPRRRNTMSRIRISRAVGSLISLLTVFTHCMCHRKQRVNPWLTAFSISIVDKGKQIGTGGTSAACPIAASIIADLNSARMEAGKPSLGFLNPFLYFAGQTALHDITEGGSKGCDGTNLQSGQPVQGVKPIPYASWNATTGWDPVTGLGTPNFERLREVVMSL